MSDADEDSLFLQELAKPGFKKTYVLNGHTNSLLHIWEYFEYTDDWRALIVFNKGIKWLEENLHKFDTGKWSRYDLAGHYASENYHQAHIKQLNRLYEITDEAFLKDYSDRFANYHQ